MARLKNLNSNPEIVNKLNTDPDYIHLSRYDNSLNKIMARYPDGAPDHVIASALMLDEGQVEQLYNEVVIKLRNKLSIVAE